MTSPFDPPSGSTPPPPPPTSPQAPIPGQVPPTPPMPAGTPTPPPPAYQGAPPPGYQAYTPMPNGVGERAGFGPRFGGWFLDSLLYGLLAVALAIPGAVVLINAFDDCVSINDELICPDGSVSGGSVALGVLLIAVAVLVVFAIYVRALGKTGQTWGRKIVGIKVVGEMTGQPIGIGKAIGRQLFASFISGQIFYLGYLWMLWDDKKQTWHDKIVSSIVVRA